MSSQDSSGVLIRSKKWCPRWKVIMLAITPCLWDGIMSVPVIITIQPLAYSLLQMWYIIEASLPHAKLLNQTLILPSYIYAWGCKHEMWVQVLQYTIHHIYHICHIQRDLHKVCNHGKLRGCYRGWWMVWTSYGWADVSEWMLPSVTFDIHLCPFSRGWCCKCNIMEGGGRSPLNLDSLLFDIAALHVHYQ